MSEKGVGRQATFPPGKDSRKINPERKFGAPKSWEKEYQPTPNSERAMVPSIFWVSAFRPVKTMET